MSCTQEEFMVAMQAEIERLDFIEQRDGVAGLIRFSAQTYRLYCAAMKNIKSMARTREHRYKFFASCLVFEDTLTSYQTDEDVNNLTEANINQ